MQRSSVEDDQPVIPLKNATEMKRQEKQAYEKQMARITLLKQTEQKNLHLAKLYEMATEKIENGHFVKRQLKELQDEAKLLQEEKMKKRKDEIKRRFLDFKSKTEKRKNQKERYNCDSNKQLQVKEYKEMMKSTLLKTKDTIFQQNQKIRETLQKEEELRKEKKKETERLEKLKAQQYYREKVSYVKLMEEQLKKSREKLIQDEQMLQSRLQETQNLLSKSQKRFIELQSQGSLHSSKRQELNGY